MADATGDPSRASTAVSSQAPGAPVWEVVADYLRDQKTVSIDKLESPTLKNVSGNPGISDYG